MSCPQEFFLTLMSNDSVDKYPDNTLSNFTNYLDVPIDLYPKAWKVGISEIFYNPFVPSYLSGPEHQGILDFLTKEDSSRESTGFLNSAGSFMSDFLFIYCDIIELKTVGSQSGKILKVMPVPFYPEKVLRFPHIEYSSIHDSHIRTISIKITNQEGYQTRFKNSILPTMITLHFKKIAI